MDFNNMKTKLANNFAEKLGTNNLLYEVEVNKDELWNLYLDSFPAGTNLIYRKRREYDCSCCKHFIQRIGGTVYIDDDLNVHSIFEFDTGSDVFQPVMDALDAYVKSKLITGIFIHDTSTVGTDHNRELMPDGAVKTWDHFFIHLPEQCYETKKSTGTKKATLMTRGTVFKRSLDEISLDAIDTVLDLISENTLYKGPEWKTTLESLRTHKITYSNLPDDKKLIYAWKQINMISDVLATVKNHSIGVLLTDLSEGVDLEDAVKRYEKITAPSNYKRPKAIFTARMLEEAKQKITELGYMDSLQRRYATIDDIAVNNVLFSNKDVTKKATGDLFDEMMTDIPMRKPANAETISIDTFVEQILPSAENVEVYLENRHETNMVSLIAPVNKEAPSMFKWNNGFSWAYAGNITDSDIRENVKNAGGNVDGVLRFSIQWNDTDQYSRNDVDAHCFEPGGDHIYFFKKVNYLTKGNLDVDIRCPIQGKAAVENITWPNKNYMKYGEYRFFVHQYAYRGGNDGFRAEIEFDGNIYRYNYDKTLRQGESVLVASVFLTKSGFNIKHYLDSETSSREIWGLKTNNFIPVSAIMHSPNYWDDQSGTGNKHYFFMLKDCVNSENPNGFYNEFLKNDLIVHKRVFEALGGKMAVAATDNQLSGLGFSSTKRNELIVKVKNATERIYKITF